MDLAVYLHSLHPLVTPVNRSSGLVADMGWLMRIMGLTRRDRLRNNVRREKLRQKEDSRQDKDEAKTKMDWTCQEDE